MSYILDALRKSEQERARGRPPDLGAGDSGPDPERRLWPWLCGAGILAAAALGVWLLLPSFPGSAPPQAPVPPGPAAVEPEPVLPPTPAAPARPRPAPTPPARPPAKPVPPGAADRAAPSAAGARPLGQPREHLAPIRPKIEERPPVEEPADQDPDLEPGPAPMGPPPAATAPAPAPAPQAGPPLREAVERMTLNVLVYSEARADRMVYIDGRQYTEGEKVQGRYLVESITPDGAVLSANGERVVLRAKPSPFSRP
jgi:hypothetical protein